MADLGHLLIPSAGRNSAMPKETRSFISGVDWNRQLATFL